MGDAMHRMETRMLLRHGLEAGESKAELARRFGVSRRTIHHWIETDQLDRDVAAGAARYAERARVAHKLDPYKGIIDARLSAYPKLSARRLFEEVRSAGYAGGYGRVRDYVREARPRVPEEPVVRFETLAGWQGQVDFGEFRLPWGRRHALLVVLGYSRLLWMRFYPRQTMDALFAGLEDAFGRFGGVPRELLFDQMRSVVTSDGRADGGELVVNAEFQRFAAHWGVPRARLPPVPRPHEGQGGASDPLCAGELHLRSGVRRRLGSGRPGAALAGRHRQPASARHDRGASGGPLRAGRAGGAGAAGGAALRPPRRGGAERAGQGVRRGAGGGGAAPAERLRGGGSMSVASASRRDRLREMLADLRMPGALEAVDQVLADMDGGAATAAEAIERLLAAQIAPPCAASPGVTRTA